jgi:hypothetical protein
MCEKKQKMCGGRSHSTLTNIFCFLSCRFSLLSNRSRGLMENLGLIFLNIKKPASLKASGLIKMVRKERLELSRREALEPKSSASTNSATFARVFPGPRL